MNRFRNYSLYQLFRHISRRNMKNKRQQKGSTSVEFAMAAFVFFLLIFSVIEIGRLLFYVNTLTEVTRRGARVAAVCPLHHEAIKKAALFNQFDGSPDDSRLFSLTPLDIEITYLNEDSNTISNPDNDYYAIRFVRVAIDSDFEYQLLIPWFKQLLDLPTFATTLPRESLGVPRDGESATCFGVS